MFRQIPSVLIDTATAGGATQAKTLFPNATYTATLPSIGSGQSAPITKVSDGSVVGGIFAPGTNWPGVLLDYAGVGAAVVTVTVEIGKLQASGGICQPLASVTLKSITTAGTVADVNPFTGATTTGTTWRLYDAATITGLGSYDALSKNIGGTESEQPSELFLTTDEAPYYYAIVTDLSTATSFSLFMTPFSSTITRTKAGP